MHPADGLLGPGMVKRPDHFPAERDELAAFDEIIQQHCSYTADRQIDDRVHAGQRIDDLFAGNYYPGTYRG